MTSTLGAVSVLSLEPNVPSPLGPHQGVDHVVGRREVAPVPGLDGGGGQGRPPGCFYGCQAAMTTAGALGLAASSARNSRRAT